MTNTGRVVVMAGDKQHPNLWTRDGEQIGEPEAVHAGQQDVGHEQVERTCMPCGGHEWFLAARCLKHRIAVVDQHPGDQVTEDGVVVDQQYRLPAS